MRVIEITSPRLKRLYSAIRNNCTDKNSEIVDIEEVIAKVLNVFVVWAEIEKEYYNNENNIYQTISNVLRKMETGELIIDVKLTNKQMREFLNKTDE